MSVVSTVTKQETSTDKARACANKAAAFSAAGDKAMARIYKSFARGWSRHAAAQRVQP
jgi:hypothetical protein